MLLLRNPTIHIAKPQITTTIRSALGNTRLGRMANHLCYTMHGSFD